MGLFFACKNDALLEFITFCKKVQNKKGFMITRIVVIMAVNLRIQNSSNFVTHTVICMNSLALGLRNKMLLLNKNRTLSEMARVMLNQFSLPRYLWAEAVNTACYILNRVLIRPISKKTPYVWFDRTPNVSYFKIFGCKCFILNTKDNLSKFDENVDEG
ncbi:uncharacterized protein M6B38_393620 [Iris pallida]|uniref:Retrovirus-related Pol polyprotein from transposon TNT 1-94 n=1 Tax=Iris pallida TaxID=29817 RepID=A0AAX6FYY3_IRIPA|nr:uncharacterized protein M6B38_393620 [Iris pallida]